MDWMSFFLEIIKMTLPALAVFLVTFFVLRQYLDSDYQRRLLDLRKENTSQIMPIKMQAYERMILFLERINPSSLLLRHTSVGMTAGNLKHDLVAAINEEYNHNIAQQLYLSPQAWKLIRVVKEQLLAIINQSYSQLEPGASGVDLSKAILDTIIRNEEIPTDKAIDFLKKEFKLIFD